jgi:putative ABC transport system permease protein
VNANLTGVASPERIEGEFVSVNYFSVLGVVPSIGRTFDSTDYRTGVSQVVVIGDSLWKRQFQSRPDVIGREIRLDGDLVTVIGVMPPSFRHPGRSTRAGCEFWAAAGYRTMPFSEPRRSAIILESALARLRSDVTPEQARDRLKRLVGHLQEAYPDAYPEPLGWSLQMRPIRDALVAPIRATLMVLLAAVAFVLLIACANVANLMLARASIRSRELAVRSALGASRGQLVRQLLMESLILAALGGLSGLFVTAWSTDILGRLISGSVAALPGITLDGRVLAFTLLLSVTTTVLFGVGPAIQATGRMRLHALKTDGRRSSDGYMRSRLRAALIIGEFALSLVLLVGAGLLIRSFWELQAVPTGFQSDNVLTARLWMPLPNDPSTGRYIRHDQRLPFYRSALRAIQSLPGVESVGFINRIPMDGSLTFRSNNGVALLDDEGVIREAEVFQSSPGYFEAVRIPLVRGRLFTDFDDPDAPPVAVVSQSFAARYFPGQDAIGRQLRPGPEESTAPWLTIVGVVGDVKTLGYGVPSPPQVYRSLFQASNLAMKLVVRTNAPMPNLGASLHSEIRRIDADLPIFAVMPMDQIVSEGLGPRTFLLTLLVVFAGVALTLSAVGIYGVMSYLVSQRTQEMGIRLALGAARNDVMRLIITDGLRLVAGGMVLGVAASLALTRILTSFLFNVSPVDPIAFGTVLIILTAAAALAAYVPARRASRLDPMIALRYE